MTNYELIVETHADGAPGVALLLSGVRGGRPRVRLAALMRTLRAVMLAKEQGRHRRQLPPARRIGEAER
eukprot:1125546-Prymnesium_polylepis.1